jgi:hypothetical protein
MKLPKAIKERLQIYEDKIENETKSLIGLLRTPNPNDEQVKSISERIADYKSKKAEIVWVLDLEVK